MVKFYRDHHTLRSEEKCSFVELLRNKAKGKHFIVYTVNGGNRSLYLLYFTCEESDTSNQLRVQLSSHVKNITNQHLEWNHLANHSKALK